MTWDVSNRFYLFLALLVKNSNILFRAKKATNTNFYFYRYYSLDVSYFKSELDNSLLEFLWNRYWVNTLSSSNLLTVNNRLCRNGKHLIILSSCFY
jgi:hypothetical protein